MKNRGVNEAFTEVARIALRVQLQQKEKKGLKDQCAIM